MLTKLALFALAGSASATVYAASNGTHSLGSYFVAGADFVNASTSPPPSASPAPPPSPSPAPPPSGPIYVCPTSFDLGAHVGDVAIGMQGDGAGDWCVMQGKADALACCLFSLDNVSSVTIGVYAYNFFQANSLAATAMVTDLSEGAQSLSGLGDDGMSFELTITRAPAGLLVAHATDDNMQRLGPLLLNPNLYPTCFDDTCAPAALRAAAPAKEARHSAGGPVAVVFLAVGAAVAAGLVRRKRAVAADDAAPMV